MCRNYIFGHFHFFSLFDFLPFLCVHLCLVCNQYSIILQQYRNCVQSVCSLMSVSVLPVLSSHVNHLCFTCLLYFALAFCVSTLYLAILQLLVLIIQFLDFQPLVIKAHSQFLFLPTFSLVLMSTFGSKLTNHLLIRPDSVSYLMQR